MGCCRGMPLSHAVSVPNSRGLVGMYSRWLYQSSFCRCSSRRRVIGMDRGMLAVQHGLKDNNVSGGRGGDDARDVASRERIKMERKRRKRKTHDAASRRSDIDASDTVMVPVSRQGMIVHHLVELGEFDEGFLEQQPVNTLNWCIRILGKYKRPDVAEQLFHWMRLKGMANEHSLLKLFEALEAARCPPARSVRAWRNVSRMQCPFTPGCLSTAGLLKTFRPSKDLKGALRILKEVKMRGLPLNEYGYNIVIRIAADCGDVDTALALEEELRLDGNSKVDVRTYSSLMHALASTQKWSQTRMVDGLLRRVGLRPDATLALQLISGYARCGWPAAAEAILDEFSENTGHDRPNRSHWNALLYAYATARQYNGCLMAYKRMTQEVGIRPDSYTMVALLKAGRRSQAGRTAVSFVLHQVQEHDVAITVELASSAIACCRTVPYVSKEEAVKSKDLADSVWDLMIDSGIEPNRIAYNTLMAARADAGDLKGVKELFDSLEKNPHVYPDEATWNILLKTYEREGDWKSLESTTVLRDTWRTLHDP